MPCTVFMVFWNAIAIYWVGSTVRDLLKCKIQCYDYEKRVLYCVTTAIIRIRYCAFNLQYWYMHLKPCCMDKVIILLKQLQYPTTDSAQLAWSTVHIYGNINMENIFSYCINNFSASSPCLITSPQRNSKSSGDISYLVVSLSRNATHALLRNFLISGSFFNFAHPWQWILPLAWSQTVHTARTRL